ncbi:MAG: SulP family inorganic anion transporter [Halanaerobiaceae bacterium]
MFSNFVQMVQNYRKEYLHNDFSAGLSVAAIALPQNMAYALIAGVNPVYGIYTSMVSMLTAVLVGESDYLVVGPTNVMAMTIASSLSFMSQDNYLTGIFILTLMVGIFQFLLSILKLGQLVNYIPRPVLVGLITGVAMIIGVGQLNEVLGIPDAESANVVQSLYNLFLRLPRTNYYSLGVGLITVAIILLLKRYYPRVPSYLTALFFSMLLVYFFNLQENLEVVRDFSSALPVFKIHSVDFSLIRRLAVSAFATSVLGFIQVLSIVNVLEERTGQRVNLNKEFQAQGIINIVCAFFQSFAISGSFTNTFANFEAGARTRISELITGVTFLAFLVFFSSLARYIPIAALAAMVVLVAYTMIDISSILQSFRTTSFDRNIFLVTLTATLLSPRLDYAVYLGLILSFVLVVKNTGEINDLHLAYSNEKEEFFPEDRPEAETDDFLIINLTGTMHFNTTPQLNKELNKIDIRDKKYIIRMGEIEEIDLKVIKELNHFIERVYNFGGEVLFCGVDEEMYKVLDRNSIVAKVGKENIFEQKEEVFRSTKRAVRKADGREGGT